jgi:predicted GIY-YIG superfamily endonuclease
MQHIDPKDGKEFLYFGGYIDTDGNAIFKIGTTNDLNRRKEEHDRAYAKTPNHPRKTEFVYLTYIQLSKLNTLRYENLFKEQMILSKIGEYVENDRFVMSDYELKQPLLFTIRNEYTINLLKLLEMK